MKTIQVYNREKLVAEIRYNIGYKQVLSYKSFTDDILSLPFGTCTKPNHDMLMEYLESRCVPLGRAHAQGILGQWGMTSFDIWEILQKTHGLMFQDHIWLKFDGEEVAYNDIKFRD